MSFPEHVLGQVCKPRFAGLVIHFKTPESSMLSEESFKTHRLRTGHHDMKLP